MAQLSLFQILFGFSNYYRFRFSLLFRLFFRLLLFDFQRFVIDSLPQISQKQQRELNHCLFLLARLVWVRSRALRNTAASSIQMLGAVPARGSVGSLIQP